MIKWAIISFVISLIAGFFGLPGVDVLMTVLFLVYLLYLQTTVLLDSRRTARELTAQRELADQAEASRFTELRTILEERMQKVESVVKDDQALAATRIAELESALRLSIEQGTNTLASYIGEFEDRMERGSNSSSRPPRI